MVMFFADSDTGSKRLKVTAIATFFAGTGVLMVIIYCSWRKLSSIESINFWKKEDVTHQRVKAFLRNHGPLAIRRYNYLDIKTITKSFKDKLGQEGYGCVYKGKLQDGSFVAVKVLNHSKGNGEEFINEVASISRTSHVNIVTLRGFCFEGSKRVLIYELMPNGSLEKFIYKGNPSSSNHQLGWEILYKIAIGIARGLEYLHRGCNTRILHFDIKPHNILLDENFCPKISDFGLAKICPREKSNISMVGARGTIGYIAPEVFCRSFGEISHKSNVYSYGMMVLEMVGGRKNIDVSVDLTSEIYFPHWIYKHLELNEELGLLGLLKEGDEDIAKKMIIVSLWCIQTDPSDRPSMSKVVDMLEGSLESLQIPPKPYLSSPPRSPIDSSTVMMSIQYDSIPRKGMSVYCTHYPMHKWEILYKIAIGIARGLEYLHRGCNTRILHFDIKPHNILLDENFCPKISDFGLAKICPREKSNISMVGARGTIGYIAPEVFCRSFGEISHKSNVYSYGMMVLEMVGGRKNIDVSVDLTSEIYFPHWIYKHLELNEELGLLGLLKEGDEDIAKKMIIVSLWCIQTDPSDRPSMSKVVDMLEGSLESLQIPPKPYLSSPPRSPIDSSTVMMSIQYDSMH
nr:LEAF RUST 10 DISEASE-RESISTANCE LOCUS RECEPTOR-LIKE PROTEIN KINASE-like 2.2 [Quercus suber]